jgi:hypothetical protein
VSVTGGEIELPACSLDARREALLSPAPPFVDLNGIDFVEVDPADHRILRVTFLKPIPAGGYGIPADLSRVEIDGGTRIVGIQPVSATVESTSVLRITLDTGGDYSPYVLTLDAAELDSVTRSTVFSFMASCPTDVDCRPAPCPPDLLAEPALDYLAKDYHSFRRLLLDLLPSLNPGWLERNPADLGIALVELLAYTGDHLSYYQDAVANEAYLDTVRTRISARRHARLIDYRMHDGRNAWTAVHFTVNSTGTLPRGTALFTRITAPLPGSSSSPDPVIPAGAVTVDDLALDPSLAGVVAFETTYTAELYESNNEIRIHTWDDEECCLPAGTREAYLYSLQGPSTAIRPVVAVGDYLILEEARSPRTGAAPDADRQRRRLVLVDSVDDGVTDPLYSDTLAGDALQVRTTAGTPLPLLHVTWQRADALDLPFCVSASLADGTLVRNVSLVRGNVVLADHGLTTAETASPDRLTIDGRLQLTRGALTMECRPAEPSIDPVTGRIDVDRRAVGCDVREALPALALLITTQTEVEEWLTVSDLLESGPFDRTFVAEVDDEGRAVLRFGDDEYGRSLGDFVSLDAVYRVGNGCAGNIGAETLFHVAPLAVGNWIDSLRNPLAAQAGVDAETIEQVRQLAPQAFHSELFRAVTAEDWSNAARELAGVAGAVATYRWTGSWTTIFVAVDPADRADLTDLPNGRTLLDPAFELEVRAFLARYRIAGYDIELRPPSFVPIDLVVEVCTTGGYFRNDVAQAVRDALSNRLLPDGTRGFFHPDNFTFGVPLYLSRLYAAVEQVEGVDSVAIRRLSRFGQPPSGELERGVLPVGAWEIVRLDNDPSFVEHGVLTVTALGGKA